MRVICLGFRAYSPHRACFLQAVACSPVPPSSLPLLHFNVGYGSTFISVSGIKCSHKKQLRGERVLLLFSFVLLLLFFADLVYFCNSSFESIIAGAFRWQQLEAAAAGSSGVSHSRCKSREEGQHTIACLLACAQLEFFTRTHSSGRLPWKQHHPHCPGSPTLIDLMKTIPCRHAKDNPMQIILHRDSSQEIPGCIHLTTRAHHYNRKNWFSCCSSLHEKYPQGSRI